MSLDGQLVLQLAHAQDLDATCALLDEAALARGLEIDEVASGKVIEVLEVQGGILDGEARVAEASLRQAAEDRHLTAFEAEFPRIARTRLRALHAFAGGLAMSRADPAPDALRLLELRTNGIHIG